MSAQGRLPKRRCASHSPETVPGTPAARCPSTERSVTFPSSSRYMSRVAASGAFSRWSCAKTVPSARRTIMNPPPPRLPASGFTTASASPVATAASTALPPAARISTPTRDANSSVEATMPSVAVTGVSSAANGHPCGKAPPASTKALAVLLAAPVSVPVPAPVSPGRQPPTSRGNARAATSGSGARRWRNVGRRGRVKSMRCASCI